MFEKAVRMKLRFNYKGLCSVEDLWDLPVTALDSIYKELNKKAKTEKEDSLLDKRTKADDLLDLQIGIVKHIVKTKLKEQEDRENAAMKREKKQKLLSIMAEKQDKALYDMPLEDLEKMVNDLG
jgi:hypothetical protein